MSHFENYFDKPVAPTNVGVRQFRNYVDLTVGRLQVGVNHSAGTCTFSFPVKNLGDLPARGPFSIVVGVSYQLATDDNPNTLPLSYTHEAVYTFGPENEIAGNSTYMTPPITAFLGYIDVDNVNKYSVEIIVDSELQVTEANETNNRKTVTWFTSSPSSARQNRNPDEALVPPSVIVLRRHTKDSTELSNEDFSKELAKSMGEN